MPVLQQCRRRDVIPQARRPGHPKHDLYTWQAVIKLLINAGLITYRWNAGQAVLRSSQYTGWLSPTKQRSKPRQIEIWNTIN